MAARGAERPGAERLGAERAGVDWPGTERAGTERAGAEERGQNSFAISVAAKLTGMHPQTLRQYDRLGLVSPHRTAGRGRRYTNRDLKTLRLVQELSQVQGVNLAGIKQILALQDEVERLRAALRKLEARAEAGGRVFAVDTKGSVVPIARGRRVRRPARGELVIWKSDKFD